MNRSRKTASDAVPNGLTRREMAAIGMGLSTAAVLAPAAANARSSAHHISPSLEDRAGIQDLFVRYLWSYDCSDEEEFLALFADDPMVVGRGTNYRDRETILGWFRYLVAMREREGDDIWMHEAGQFHFAPYGGGCVVYAYATHFNANTARSARGVRSLGYFVCDCIRERGEWKFRRLSISTWDRNKLPWKKPLPWAEADKG